MPPHVTYPYTGRLIVRLAESVVRQIIQRARTPGLPDLQSLEEAVSILPELSHLRAVLQDYPGLLTPPVIEGFSVADVLAFEEKAAHSPFSPIHSLTSYYVIDPRKTLSLADSEQLLMRLQSTALRGEVDLVYREPELAEAGVWAVTPDDIWAKEQEYLKGGVTGPHAYKGINADCLAVWGNHNGSTIGFVDLERGWNIKRPGSLGHEDLPTPTKPVYNVNVYDPNDPTTDHGTAVLGVVVGVDNTQGIIGIAPGATLLRVVSRVKSSINQWDLVGAVLAAIQVMMPGDVLLIEVETVTGNPIRGYPVEIVDHWFDAIRLAAGNGMVVIEAAGNGTTDAAGNEIGRNLDQLASEWPGAPTWRSLNRNSATFLDSGAIMVSACSSAVTPSQAHTRMPFASYGSRIDCYAWGENVYTSGYGYTAESPNDENKWYTNVFAGTSSASAIIAGAAILVQEMHLKAKGWRLSPAQVRTLLSDPGSGVKVVDTNGLTEIGRMPDLGKVAGKIPIIPDVFIRDSVNDAGAVPNSLVFQSPDIIVRSTQSPNPAAEYGQGSLLANTMPPNDPVAPNTANYLYVRMRNRSTIPAVAVRATIYWSEASPLVAPVHWNLIGKTNPINVAAGGDLAVAGPYIWTPPTGGLPASGHGCFVALLDHPLDPAPPLLPSANPLTSAATSWDDFLAYLGRNNNVAWRNFSVLQLGGSSAMRAIFFIRGTGDQSRIFTIEVIHRLQDDVRVWWEVPTGLAEKIGRSPQFPVIAEEPAREGVRLLLKSQRMFRLPDLRLDADACYQCFLEIDLPRRHPLTGGSVAIRQIFRGIEVGRLTWVVTKGKTSE